MGCFSDEKALLNMTHFHLTSGKHNLNSDGIIETLPQVWLVLRGAVWGETVCNSSGF